jgi:lipid-binding SYLF domain-containing protein
MQSRTTRYLSALISISALLISSVSSAAGTRQDARLMTATQVLGEMQASADQNVPHWLLERAYAVAVVPGVIKVGLGLGGRRGSGVLVVRKDNGHWTNPVFVNLTGGSFGFQIGVQSSDILLVFTTRQSTEGIVGGKVTLGADASVAAGPVGRQTAAATDIGLTAQVYTYSRAQGLFAGVALDGSAVTIDRKSNAAYYNQPGILASEIIAGNTNTPPDSTREFVAALDKILGVATPAAVANTPASTTSSPTATPFSPAPSQPSQSLEATPGKLTTHPMEDPRPGGEPPQ